uniref:(California timema) hypothetical protein n=1 Tax=Timema californicum TaxID=61474 RepID=A0A7R9P2V3_TIMCA|nr:unnamed protein product [Timema californicum]
MDAMDSEQLGYSRSLRPRAIRLTDTAIAPTLEGLLQKEEDGDFSGESDNDEHFVIETAQSDSDSECNLSDNELEIVPEQPEDLEHYTELSGLTKKIYTKGSLCPFERLRRLLYRGIGYLCRKEFVVPKVPGILWETRIQHFGAFEKIGSHHTRLPQPSVEGGTSTTSRNEENDDHGVLAVRSPANLARTPYCEYLRILNNVRTQKRNIVLVENSNHLDLGDVSVYPDTREILVVRVYLEKRKSKMELPENVNVTIKFEVTEPKSECVIPSIKEDNEMNCNSTKYVNEVVKSEVPDIFEPFSQCDLPLIKEELETELPENIKPEETKPKFVCGIPLIKEENENTPSYGELKADCDSTKAPATAASPRLPSTGRHSVRLGQRLSVLNTLTRHCFLVVTISEGSEAGTNTVLVSRDGDESRAWPSSGKLRLRDQL